MSRTLRERGKALLDRFCRPLSAYKSDTSSSERYVDEFSRKLGLKPSPTKLGGKTIKI